METLIALAAGLFFGAGLLFLLARQRSPAGLPGLEELRGRLTQMAESQAAQQRRLYDQLQAQERALAKALEERLGDLTKKVGDSLQQSAQQNQTTLTDLRERLAVIDKAQQTLAALSSEMVGLRDILGNKQARGAFGEVQLQSIVESLLPPSAYEFQVTLGNGKRVDCLLRLPDPPGAIAVDSKFPLESYQALRDSTEPQAQNQARRAFSADVRKHIQDIAERYILPGETADTALMFLPAEAVYAELHANFRDVVEASFKARVFIVSPTTMMATLNTVRAVLRDARMHEQAGLIQVEVAKMLSDVERLDKRVVSLESHFDLARRDIDQIRTSTGKITRKGEKILELELEDNPAEPLEETGEIAEIAVQ